MKNQPLVVSIIIGIIVVFVIVGASLVAKLSSVNKLYRGESLKNITLEKKNDELSNKITSLKKDKEKLSNENNALKDVTKEFKNQIADDVVNIKKLNKFNKVLEEKLKNELLKNSNDSGGAQPHS